jgi:hypothetical protein
MTALSLAQRQRLRNDSRRRGLCHESRRQGACCDSCSHARVTRAAAAARAIIGAMTVARARATARAITCGHDSPRHGRCQEGRSPHDHRGNDSRSQGPCAITYAIKAIATGCARSPTQSRPSPRAARDHLRHQGHRHGLHAIIGARTAVAHDGARQRLRDDRRRGRPYDDAISAGPVTQVTRVRCNRGVHIGARSARLWRWHVGDPGADEVSMPMRRPPKLTACGGFLAVMRQ